MSGNTLSYLQKPAVLPSCGVKQSLYSTYTLDDHQWSNPQTRSQSYCGQSLIPLFDSLLVFAERCIMINGRYWMRIGLDNSWMVKNNASEAHKEAINLWQHQRVGSFKIDKEFLNIFFDGVIKLPQTGATGKLIYTEFHIGSCPHFQGITCIPYGPMFINYKGLRQLNIWSDRRLVSDFNERSKGRLMLRLIYRSLCSGVEIDADSNIEMDKLEEQVLTGQFTNNEFKFMIMWLAAQYQKPGVKLQTNVWLCGLLEGLGKGSVAEIQRVLLGRNISVLFNQKEIERGWSDFLIGKSFVEVDELDTKTDKKFGGKFWGNWIKTTTIKHEASFTQRNIGTNDVINIGNYLFTINDEEPIYIDKSDRRNYFIKTSDDAQWVEYASVLQSMMIIPEPEKVAAGFGWYLERVDVDYQYIGRAHNNIFKTQIQEGSMNSVEFWLLEDPVLPRNKWTQSTELFEYYGKWFRKFMPKDTQLNHNKFGRAMTALARTQSLGVEKRMQANLSQYKIGAVITAPIINKAAIRSSVVAELNGVSVINATINNIGVSAVDITPDLEEQDYKIDGPIADFSKMTPLEKIRARLRMLENENSYGNFEG